MKATKSQKRAALCIGYIITAATGNAMLAAMLLVLLWPR
jgi:hypothetical protein